MLEPEDITAALVQLPANTFQDSTFQDNTFQDSQDSQTNLAQDLQDIHVVITAGPTREAIDPVRYISNRSSGKQGYAIAEQAAQRGARVTLVSGPTALPTPPGVDRVDVVSALDMLEAVTDRLEETQLFIGVAAVADYRIDNIAEHKIKKTDDTKDGISLNLIANPDIIATVAANPDGPITVGFAAETNNGLEHARGKLLSKGLELIALNDVSDSRIGFRSNENALTLLWADGEAQLARQDKTAIAASLLDKVLELFGDQLAARK